jgi:hypothetical protein
VVTCVRERALIRWNSSHLLTYFSRCTCAAELRSTLIHAPLFLQKRCGFKPKLDGLDYGNQPVFICNIHGRHLIQNRCVAKDSAVLRLRHGDEGDPLLAVNYHVAVPQQPHASAAKPAKAAIAPKAAASSSAPSMSHAAASGVPKRFTAYKPPPQGFSSSADEQVDADSRPSAASSRKASSPAKAKPRHRPAQPAEPRLRQNLDPYQADMVVNKLGRPVRTAAAAAQETTRRGLMTHVQAEKAEVDEVNFAAAAQSRANASAQHERTHQASSAEEPDHPFSSDDE